MTTRPDLRPDTSPTAPRRDAWIDTLRVAVIVGVVGAHVAVIYALDVGWWYEERTASEAATTALAVVFAPGLLFGMGLLFFLAGWFTPVALERKGPRRFVVDRLWRLGVPTAAYLFVVNPALNVVGDRASGERETLSDYLRLTYRDDVEFGIAWFMAALLAFSMLYAAWRSRRPARQGSTHPLRRRELVVVAAFIAVASFVVRVWFPVLAGDLAWTLNLWEYPQMAALFVLGIDARERGWLDDGLAPPLRRTCGWAAGVGLALAMAVGAVVTLAGDPDPFLGGLRFEATLIPLVEATLALGMSLWLVDWFRRHGERASPRRRALARSSFGVYLVHVPVTILLAVALRDVGVAAEVKFLLVLGLGLVASFGLAGIVSRSRLGSRIL